MQIQNDQLTIADLLTSSYELLNEHLKKLGVNGEQLFFSHHGNIPHVGAANLTAKQAITASFYLSKVLTCPDEQKREWFHTTDLKLRITDCYQLLKSTRQGVYSPLVMPGNMTFMKMKSTTTSLLLLIAFFLVLWLKKQGVFDKKDGYMITSRAMS